MKRLSALQKGIMTVVAAIDEKQPGQPVPVSLIGRMLNDGGHGPVYGPNLRASCRRLATAGWLRMLRAKDLSLAVELTETGDAAARPLLQAERDASERRRRETEVCVLASAPSAIADAAVTVTLAGEDHVIRSAAYVIRLDGAPCLQLERPDGGRTLLTGDALQVAGWYRTCQQAGLPVRVQVNPDGKNDPRNGDQKQ